MRAKRRRRQIADINVVPYIDVMLVLLIIFMVTAPLITQGVKVDLPKAAAKKLPPQTQLPIVVTVNSRGRYFLNVANNPRVPLTARSLQAQVKTALLRDRSKKVYVRGDAKAAYGEVVGAMALLQKAGVGSVGLMTDDKKA